MTKEIDFFCILKKHSYFFEITNKFDQAQNGIIAMIPFCATSLIYLEKKCPHSVQLNKGQAGLAALNFDLSVALAVRLDSENPRCLLVPCSGLLAIVILRLYIACCLSIYVLRTK